MATFLQLCQDVARESGTISGVQPASVTGQTQRLLKIVNWTASAWNRIQTDRDDWRWMRASFTAPAGLVIGSPRYTANSFNVARFGAWLHATPRFTPFTICDPAIGASDESELREISYERWLTEYGRGQQTNGRPGFFAISPSDELCFGPLPDLAYTVKGEYQRSPQALVNNDDVPELPVRFHDIIRWRALMLLARHDEAPGALRDATIEYDALLDALERAQTPTIRIGGDPIA